MHATGWSGKTTSTLLPKNPKRFWRLCRANNSVSTLPHCFYNLNQTCCDMLKVDESDCCRCSQLCDFLWGSSPWSAVEPALGLQQEADIILWTHADACPMEENESIIESAHLFRTIIKNPNIPTRWVIPKKSEEQVHNMYIYIRFPPVTYLFNPFGASDFGANFAGRRLVFDQNLSQLQPVSLQSNCKESLRSTYWYLPGTKHQDSPKVFCAILVLGSKEVLVPS